MAKNDKVKKRKLTKKQLEINKPEKKKLKKKKKPQIQDDDSDNDSSSSETDSEKIQKLLEPYTKDQLIGFLVDAAAQDADLFGRLRTAADSDVSHRKIFVYGLGWDTTVETLTSAFKPYGEIEDCRVVADRVTGKAKGYGFVLFRTRRGATKALKQPSKKIGNRMASCQLASVGPGAPPQSQDVAGRRIYVTNVQAEADREKLRAFFAKFGEIETGPIGFDMYTGKCRGFALFVYKTEEAARKALEEPYKVYEGHQLYCKKATDGKSKFGGGAASVTTVMQPVQPPMLAALAAAQNMALFHQNPGWNPMYGGLIADPNGAFLAAGSVNQIVASGAGGYGQGLLGPSQVAQVGDAGGSLGLMGYGPTVSGGSHGFGSLGGGPSVLGSYGSGGPTFQGLQTSSAMAPGEGGSFSGYP